MAARKSRKRKKKGKNNGIKRKYTKKQRIARTKYFTSGRVRYRAVIYKRDRTKGNYGYVANISVVKNRNK